MTQDKAKMSAKGIAAIFTVVESLELTTATATLLAD